MLAIAICALGLSIFNFAWQVWTWVDRKPRLYVQHRQDTKVVLGGGGPPIEITIHIGVVNFGGAALTIDDVGLAPVTRRELGTLSVARLREQGHQIAGPDFPVRIAAENDQHEWSIPGRLVAEQLRDVEVRTFARRHFPKNPRSKKPALFLEPAGLAWRTPSLLENSFTTMRGEEVIVSNPSAVDEAGANE